MISLNFSLAVALYLAGVLIVVLFAWLLAKRQKERELFLNPDFTWFCVVCTYTYINTRDDLISTCPRCGSYNKKPEHARGA
jgi:rubrerythrin